MAAENPRAAPAAAKGSAFRSGLARGWRPPTRAGLLLGAAGTAALAAAGTDILRTGAHLAGLPAGPLLVGLALLGLAGAAAGGLVAAAFVLTRALAAAAPGFRGAGSRFRPLVASLPAGLLLALVAVRCLDGPRISLSPAAPALRIAAALSAVAGAWAFYAVLGRRLDGRGGGATPAAGNLLAVALLVALPLLAALDASVLPGHYPAFHAGLRFLLLLAAAGLGALEGSARLRWLRPLGAGALVAAAVVPALALAGIVPGRSPFARDLLLVRAPLAGTILPLFGRAGTSDAGPGRPPDADAAGVRLPEATLDAAFPGRRSWNLVLVTIDTLRADHTPFGGGARRTMPRLLELAPESAVFARAYAQAPSSPLSFGSLFTGLYPRSVHALIDAGGSGNGCPPGLEPRTLAGRLRAAGFRTLGVTAFPEAYFRRHFPHVLPGFERFVAAGAADSDPAPDVCEAAREALAAPESGRRFLWVHLLDPHFPYRRHAEHDFGGGLADLYDGEIAYADHHLGRFLDTLRAGGDWDRTAVVVHGDHGEALGEHGDQHHGSSLHEEQIRVPLLVRFPGLAARRIAAPVGLVDLLPTLIEILGVDAGEPCEGRSLAGALAGAPAADPPPHPEPRAFAELLRPTGEARVVCAVTPRWKVLHRLDTDTFQLFDLEADPGETRDLAIADPAALAEARKALAAFPRAPRGAPRRPGTREAAGAIAAAAANAPSSEQIHRLRDLVLADESGAVPEEVFRHLDPARPPSVRLEALHILACRAPGRARSVLGSWLLSPDVPERLYALGLLPAIGDRAALDLLDGLPEPQEGVFEPMARIVRAGCGDPAAAAVVGEGLDRPEYMLRLLGAVAAARRGSATGLEVCRSLLFDPDLTGDAQDPILVFARTRRLPEALLALYEQMALREAPDVSLVRLLWAIAPYRAVSQAPLLRQVLLDASPVHRAAGTRALADLGLGGWIPGLEEINRLLLAARSQLARSPGLAAETSAAAVRDSAAKGALDWGLAYEAWTCFMAAGRPADAAELAASLIDAVAVQDSEAAAILRRLERIGRLSTGPVRVAVEALDAPDPLHASHGIRVRIRVSPESRAVPGGFGPWSPKLRLSLAPSAAPRAAFDIQRHLPAWGLLPGESATLLVAWPALDLHSGRYRLEAAVESNGDAGFASTARSVELDLGR